MSNILVIIIRGYKTALSPILEMLFGKGCRFSPTCSVYSITAIERHGALKGGKMAIKRVLKCHPFSEGSYDPVPDLT